MFNLEYVILIIVIALITYYKKALDLYGSLFMIIMGLIIIFTAGSNWLILIFIFLFLGLISTQYKHSYKKDIGVYEGTRSIKNVISNGIVPLVMAIFGNYGGFIGSIATATADTLASELGVTQQPRLVTTFKKVPPGTDGGISVVGTISGITGAGIIGLAAYLLGIFPDPYVTLKIAIIAGAVGCFVDSILGATLEQRHYISNEYVNLIATITGAVLGILMV